MNSLKADRSNILSFILAGGALLWGMTLPVQAADAPYGTRSKQVLLTDLNLSTVAGQETARERLHQMARHLCGQVEDLNDLSHQWNYVKCVEEATARTLPHLNALIRGADTIRTAAVGQPQR